MWCLSVVNVCDACLCVRAQVLRENLKLTSPLTTDFPFYVLIETSGSMAAHDEEKLSLFLERVLEQGLVADGTVAAELSKIKVSFDLRMS